MRRFELAISLLMFALTACSSRGTDPLAMLPQDAEAWFALAPIETSGGHLGRVLSRLPDGAGLADLMRSVTGIDVMDPARSRESGLDPRRGALLAVTTNKVLLVLPVSDTKLASRRLGLRLARLGLIEQEDPKFNLRVFAREDSPDLLVALRMTGGLALVGAGGADLQDWLASLAPSAGGRAQFDAVLEEAGPQGADAVGLVRNARLVGLMIGFLKTRSEVPQEASRKLALWSTLLGDLRWAMHFDEGIQARMILGLGQGELAPLPAPAPMPSGIAAWARIDLPEALLRVVREGVRGQPDLGAMFDAFGGRLVVSLLTDSRIPPVPILADDRFFNRARLAFGMGLRPEALPPAFMTAFSVEAVREGAQVSPWLGAMPEGTTLVLPRGQEVSLTSNARFLLGVTGTQSRAYGADGLFTGRWDLLPGLMGPEGDTIATIAADPGAVLQALSLGEMDFARHLVGALKSLDVRVAWTAGRLVSDLRLVAR